MKTLNLIFTLALTLLLSGVIYSQNITGTLGTNGVFKIKDASNDYLTLSQTNGNLSLFRNLELGVDSISTSIRGVITKNGRRFIHNYQAPGTNGKNTFIGLEAGNFTMSGMGGYFASHNTGVGYRSLYSLTEGYGNSAFGYASLYNNTTGFYNSAFGYQSLYSNTTGYTNSAFGNGSLFTNTTGYDNSAFGYASLYNNTIGFYNSAFGYMSLYNNTSGTYNSAFGNGSLFTNTTGVYNSAFGNNSLYSNTTGSYNSAFGQGSLYYNTSGSFNTAIGCYAGSSITSGSNNIAIGYNAQVPSGTASNQIRLGNTSITYAGIQVAWTVTSDRRYKDNITPIGLGLGFISKLNPVSYVRKNDEKGKTEYGLIAQEVEQVLKDLGIENHAMLTITDEGMYELRYNDLIAPMIKAIQELKVQNEKLVSELNDKETRISSVESQLNEILQVVNELKSKQADIKNVNIGVK